MSSSYTIFVFILALVIVTSQNDKKCRKLRYPSVYKENECITTKTWYIYASSFRCDNCCTKRTLKLLTDGSIGLIDVIKKEGDTTPIIIRGKCKRIGNSTSYKTDKGVFTILYGTDCKNTVVIYSKYDETLTIWTSDPNVGDDLWKFLPSINDCKLKLYRYHPEVACVGL